MAESVLLQQIDRNIMLVTINRAEYGNRINLNIYENLMDVCEIISSNSSIKAVIITASGNKSFCTGMDPEFIIPMEKPSPAALIINISCPVIAAINGDAFGEGLELALACDIRVAVPEAKFSLPSINEGYIPSHGGTQLLPRIIGLSKAMELVLSGDIIDAGEAKQTGLISSIIEPEKLLPAVTEMALTMTTKSPLALSYTKEAITKGLDLTLEQGLRLEADLYFLLHTTQDRSEGIKAFREKRKPDFRGL